jgi:hypothetical protein
MQPIDGKKTEWRQATVTKKVKSRSYEVSTPEGKIYRRNRLFLRSSKGGDQQKNDVHNNTGHDTVVSTPKKPSTPENIQSESGKSPATKSPKSGHTSPLKKTSVTTRSGRIIKPPEKLNL